MFNYLKRRPIFELRGGLGNQLFIFSAGIYFSSLIDKKPLFDPSGIDHGESISNFKLPVEFLSRSDVLMKQFSSRAKSILDYRNIVDVSDLIGYINEDLPLNVRSYIRGYFQDSKFPAFARNLGYFDKLNNTDDQGKLKKRIEEIQSSNGTVVHLRFGDFAKAKNTLGNLSQNYYRMIFESHPEISESPIYVMSDDYESSRKFLEDFCQLDIRFLYDLQSYRNSDQFKVFNAAHNVICANSTFSWWGGFISGNAKTVFAPYPWVKSPSLQAQFERSFYPDSFTQIPSEWI